MSAFFIAINRDREPFEKSVADLMMAQLDRFGHDSKMLIVRDHYAIGFQSHWTVPEEQGEQQPLSCDDKQWFAFYGRVDNRHELLERLAKPSQLVISDAALVQEYLHTFGQESLVDLVGPFALLSFKPDADSLILARDGMGARSLSYKIDKDFIVAATNEMALAAHPSIGYRLNDSTVARHLTSQMQPGPSSMISGLEVLYPGYELVAGKSAFALRRFYMPDPARRVVFETDDEYASEFRRLLTQAVSRRIRCSGNIGTQLSGGMDSVPVTIVAANMFSSNDSPNESSVLSAYSWVFDQYAAADERQYSSPLCQKYGLEHVMVECDDLWLSYNSETPLDPLGPVYNPFMTYNHALFEQGRSRSVKVMLNGIHGDILYGYTHGVLYELCRAGEFKAAVKEARALLSASDSLKSFFKDFVLKPLSLVNTLITWRSRQRDLQSDVLQPHIVEQLKIQAPQLNHLAHESHKAIRPQQWQVVLGDFAGGDAAIGRFLESEYAIERRYPFRDRDLVEFMLAIPSKQLAFNNVKRPIVKRAFSADFSTEFIKRNTKAYFADVTRNGVLNDEQSITWATSGSQEWTHYVKECYFHGKVEQNHLLDVVKWRCGYYDYWKAVCYHPVVKQLGLGNEFSKKDK